MYERHVLCACAPLSEHEVVRFDVGVDDVDGVQLLHHVQDADGEVHDEGLRHHLVAQSSVGVDGVLGAESHRHTHTHTRCRRR